MEQKRVPPGTAAGCDSLASEVPVIVFANEFFDALPVEVLSPKANCESPKATGDYSKPGSGVSRRTGIPRPLRRASRGRRASRDCL